MIENQMVIGDYYPRRSQPRPDRCDCCGDWEFDMAQYGLRYYCSSCSRKCAWCEDFMLKEEGDMHEGCREDWESEQKERR